MSKTKVSKTDNCAREQIASPGDNVVNLYEKWGNQKNPYLTATANAARDDLRNRLPAKYAVQASQALSDAGDKFPNHNVLTLATALAYADASLHVVDSHAFHSNGEPTLAGDKGKTPRGTKWQLRASTDPVEITAFWTGDGEYLVNEKGKVYPYASPSAYRNVSITFPPDCSLFVLDVDGDEGKAALEKLEAEHGELPQTWESISGSGGYHLIFKTNGADIRNTASSIAPGIDIRGKNGQIIASPSIHASGNFYQWDEGCAPWERDVADAPEWLVRSSFEATKGRGEPGKKKSKTKPKKKAQKSGITARQGGDVIGFEAHLETIGDGDGQRGFDAPIFSAACSYFSVNGSDADGDELFDLLRATIAAAEMKEDRSNKDRYLSDDAYLTGRIEQARTYIAEQDQDDPPTNDDDRFEKRSKWLPSWYKVRQDMIVLKGSGEGDDQEPDSPLCQAFDVIGRASNLDGTEGAGRIISFVNINGATVEMTLNRSDLYKDNGGGVIDDLAEAEMIFGGAGKRWRENLLNLFRSLRTTRQIPTLTRPGWQRDRAGDVIGFMCPTGQYVDAGRDGPAMRLHSAATVRDRETGGTLKGWQEAASVAEKYCAGNFHWTFGLAAGFVGPILGLIGGEPCGCNLSGDSSLGKTIAQKLASSVWASPAPKSGVFFPMNTTTNAIEDLASIGSESVLALDDIGNMARPSDLPPLLFGMSSGAGKSRKAGREAGLSAGAEYLPFAILSNEHSLRVAIEKALGPGAYKTGLSARFPDIDVTGCKRRDDGVIVTLESVKSHFGYAGPAFIRYLIDNGWIDRKEELASKVATAVDTIAGKNAAPAQRRAAKIFALVQIAGELACAAGLMGREKAVRLSVKIAFDRFKNSDEGRATEGAVSMLDGLRSYLTRAMGREIIPADAVEDAHYGDVKGWYTQDLIILDAGAVSDVGKLGLSGKLPGLLVALNAIGALEKSGRNNSHKVLPHDVTPNGGDNRERMVKNYRLKRDVLGV